MLEAFPPDLFSNPESHPYSNSRPSESKRGRQKEPKARDEKSLIISPRKPAFLNTAVTRRIALCWLTYCQSSAFLPVAEYAVSAESAIASE